MHRLYICFDSLESCSQIYKCKISLILLHFFNNLFNNRLKMDVLKNITAKWWH